MAIRQRFCFVVTFTRKPQSNCIFSSFHAENNVAEYNFGLKVSPREKIRMLSLNYVMHEENTSVYTIEQMIIGLLPNI